MKIESIFRGLQTLPLVVLSFLCLACSAPSGDSVGEAAAPGAEAVASQPQVDFSFVFIGCNRLGWSAKNPSTANVPQLQQTFQDIADLQTLDPSLPAPPRYLFFVGDLVRNETQDGGKTLEGQLAAWQTLWDKSPLASSQATELVPVPGNHEVLYSTPSERNPAGCDCDTKGFSCEYAEIPDADAYGKWLAWLSSNDHDQHAGNGPTPQGDPQDQLVGDNSQFTYSFESSLASGQKAHFVLINTDTESSFRTTDASCLQGTQFSGDPLPGWMPAHWADQNIAAAQQDQNVDLIFAFGHKPIEAYDGRDPKGRATILNCSPPSPAVPANLADQFLTTLQGNDKVVAYLTSHVHNWEHATPGGVHQIIAGNGGSPPSGATYFGFTLVRIYTDGSVDAVSYGRPIPDPIENPAGVGPAAPRKTVQLR